MIPEIDYLKTERSLDDALNALGTTHEQMEKESLNLDDIVEFSDESFFVAESTIHGKGVFANREFKKGEYITLARIDGKRTPAGRFANHSSKPNCAMLMIENTDVQMVALRDIDEREELTVDYYFSVLDTREPDTMPLVRELFNHSLEVIEDKALIKSRREKIHQLEVMVNSVPAQAKFKIKTTHRFIKGVYCREVFVPAGTILIGKINKSENMSIMSAGDVLVATEYGVKRIKAPFTAVSKPGIKRVGYVAEDMVWTSVIRTDETDVEKLNDILFVTNYDDVDKEFSNILEKITMEGTLCQE